MSNIGISGQHIIELQDQDDYPVEKPVRRFSGYDYPVKIQVVKITLLIAFGSVSVVGLALALLWALFFHPTALMPMAMSMFGIFYVSAVLIDKRS